MLVNYHDAAYRLQLGDALMHTKPNPELATSKDSYSFVRSMGGVSPAVFRRLRADLKPLSDGLFGSEMAQTYEWSHD